MLNKKVFELVGKELDSATKKFGPFHSTHEGYGVIKEEFDELWDEIKKKKNKRSKKQMVNEAKQVAAMAIRFMIDLC